LRVWSGLPFQLGDVFVDRFSIDLENAGDVSVGMTAAVTCGDRLNIGH